MPFHKAHTPGELIERVDGDVTTLAEFFAEMVVRSPGNALLIVAILALLYRENAPPGVILTALHAASSWSRSRLVGRIGVRAWTDAREAWADQMGFLEERFAGTEDIRGIGAEAHARAPPRPPDAEPALQGAAAAGWRTRSATPSPTSCSLWAMGSASPSARRSTCAARRPSAPRS